MKLRLKICVLWVVVVLSIHAEELQICGLPEVVIEPTSLILQEKGAGEFSMVFKNFPKNVEISMSYAHVIQKNPNEYAEVEKFKIQDDDRLLINGRLVSSYTFGAEGIAKGERVKYRYAIPDGTVIAESSFIPYSLVVYSKKKTFHVDIELLQLEPMVYSLTYHGLRNGERMRLRSFFEGDIEEEDFFYNIGKPSLYMPGVVGKAGGYALLDISRLAGDLLKVKVPWGSEVLNRVAGLLPDAPVLQEPIRKPRPHRSRCR